MSKNKELKLIEKLAKLVGVDGRVIAGLVSAPGIEVQKLSECLEIVEKKRKNALRRMNYKKGETVLMKYSEDDAYANEEFYMNRIRQCYAENTRFMRNIWIK